MDISLDDVIHFDVIVSNPSTGAAVDADSTPTFAIYEEDTDTAIVTGNFTKRTSLTGNYRGTATLSTANGFEVGKWYNVIASAVVGGVAGKAVVKTFNVVAVPGTTGGVSIVGSAMTLAADAVNASALAASATAEIAAAIDVPTTAEIVAAIAAANTTVNITSTQLADGAVLKIVRGDDYTASATPSTAITMTLTGTGIGSAVNDTFKLWLNTKGVAPVEDTASVTAPDANTLSLSFNLTAAQTATLSLFRDDARWTVRQVTQTTSYKAAKATGVLLVVANPETQRT